VSADAKVLWRADSGFDSARLLFALAAERERWAALGRSFDYLTKWNPRRQDKAAWVERPRPPASSRSRAGKRGLLDLQIERAWKKAKRTLRLVVRVTERTIDKKGQHLLVPEIEIEGWWTSLEVPMADVIELYKHHGTHEQFHSEIKTDLDLERLPSGKFDTNDAVVHLAAFAYNCLRLIGQFGLTGDALADPPPGQAPPHQDCAAGGDVPRGEVRRTRSPCGAGLRSRRRRACEGVRCGAGAFVQAGADMNASCGWHMSRQRTPIWAGFSWTQFEKREKRMQKTRYLEAEIGLSNRESRWMTTQPPIARVSCSKISSAEELWVGNTDSGR
jgi:hypothetical protein